MGKILFSLIQESSQTHCTPLLIDDLITYLSSLSHAPYNERMSRVCDYLDALPGRVTVSEIMGEAAIQLVLLRQELYHMSTKNERTVMNLRWRIELLDKSLSKILEEIVTAQESVAYNPELRPEYRMKRDRAALLEDEHSKLTQELDELESRAIISRNEILTKLDEMTGVIVFFDNYQAFLQEGSDLYQPPAFPDSKTALRLIEQSKYPS